MHVIIWYTDGDGFCDREEMVEGWDVDDLLTQRHRLGWRRLVRRHGNGQWLE